MPLRNGDVGGSLTGIVQCPRNAAEVQLQNVGFARIRDVEVALIDREASGAFHTKKERTESTARRLRDRSALDEAVAGRAFKVAGEYGVRSRSILFYTGGVQADRYAPGAPRGGTAARCGLRRPPMLWCRPRPGAPNAARRRNIRRKVLRSRRRWRNDAVSQPI